MLLNPFANLNPFSTPEENVEKRRKAIKTFKAKADAKRTTPEKLSDWLTSKLGSVVFLVLNIAFFIFWILINTSKIPAIEAFDPYPFGFLTMAVSLEAICLAIIVLVSQNREARLTELREEIELQMSTIAEGELTKLIKLMTILMEKQGIKLDDDPELKKMLKPIDNAALERELEKELDESN